MASRSLSLLQASGAVACVVQRWHRSPTPQVAGANIGSVPQRTGVCWAEGSFFFFSSHVNTPETMSKAPMSPARP